MTLAAILYPSPTAQGSEEFFWANYQHHLAIIEAVRQTKGVRLQLFQIFPAPQAGQTMTTWERQHQRQHDTMNALLGIPGVDLTGLDLKDRTKADAWFFTHFLQHQAAGKLCGMPI